MQYEYFDEITSDQLFRAYGKSVPEVFENAAKAMFGIMYDLEKIKIEEALKVEAKGEDEKQLLYRWLSNLLIEFEVEGIFFANFSIDEVKRDAGNAYYLIGTAEGSRTIPELRTAVKGVTFHRFALEKLEGRYVATVVVDI